MRLLAQKLYTSMTAKEILKPREHYFDEKLNLYKLTIWGIFLTVFALQQTSQLIFSYAYHA